jgi:hypothetical protein
MFSISNVTSQHSAANEAFQRLRRRGQSAALWAKFSGESPFLEDFKNNAFRLQAGRKHLGIQTIPVEGITGSVGRSRDFDRQFRPLKKNLRDQWAGVYQSLKDGNWPPISVYKIGKAYYVVDGHDRVSVANFKGMKYIQAEVWEYSCINEQVEACQLDAQCKCNNVNMAAPMKA